jgi:hypothetical protein
LTILWVISCLRSGLISQSARRSVYSFWHWPISTFPSPPVPMTAVFTGPPLIGPRAMAAAPSAARAGVPARAFRKLRLPCSFCSSVRFMCGPFRDRRDYEQNNETYEEFGGFRLFVRLFRNPSFSSQEKGLSLQSPPC